MIQLYKSNVFGKIITDCNILPDCAGRWSELEQIHQAFPKPFMSLGDLVDRGIGSRQVLDFFMKNEFPAVLGNHEHMFINFYRNKKFYSHLRWLSNGGYKTILSFSNSYKFKKKLVKLINTHTNLYNQVGVVSNLKELFERCDQIMNEIWEMSVKIIPEKYILWLESLPLFIETDKMILTHAPINPSKPFKEFLNIGESSDDEKAEYSVLWNRKHEISKNEAEKIQFSGHNARIEPTFFIENEELIGIGLDCSKSQRLFCYVGSEDSIYYVEYELEDYDPYLVARFPNP